MGNLNNKHSRIFYLDVLRDIAIIAVIIYHVAGGVILAGNPLLRGDSLIPSVSWLYHGFFYECFRFAVPLFLMLSGALSLGKDFEFITFLKKRLSRITYPFLFWGTITFILMLIILSLSGDYSFASSIEAFLYRVYQFVIGNDVYSSPFWFFWLILSLYLVMPILNKWILHSSFKEIEYFLIIWLVVCFFKHTLFFNLITPVTDFIPSIGFVILGYYLKFTDNSLLNNKFFYCPLIVVSILFLMVFSSIFSLNDSLFQFEPSCIFTIMEVSGIFLLFKNLDLTKMKKFLKKPVESISRNSYGMFLIHMFVLVVLVNYLQLNVGLKLKGIIFFILVFTISWLIMIIFDKIPYLNKFNGFK